MSSMTEFKPSVCESLEEDQKQGHTFEFDWSIQDFSRLPIYRYSKERPTNGCRIKTLWRVDVFLLDCPRKPKTIELFVKLIRTDKREISVNSEFCVFLMNNKNDVLFECTCGSLLSSEDSSRTTFMKMWLPIEIFSQLNDEVMIRVVTTINGCCNSATPLHEVLKVKDENIIGDRRSENVHLSQLQQDLMCAYENNLFGDVKLNIGDEIIHANKFVLSARSPFFRRLFTSTEITDLYFDPSGQKKIALEAFLSYLYTGFIKGVSLNAICILYSISNIYEVYSLQCMCSHILCSNIDFNTVCGLLQLSELHKDAALKKSAIRFIVKNFDRVQTTSYWGVLVKEYPNLQSEVGHFLAESEK